MARSLGSRVTRTGQSARGFSSNPLPPQIGRASRRTAGPGGFLNA